MKNIENKKIPIKIILTSLLGIIISTFIKEPKIYEDGSVSTTNFDVIIFDYKLIVVVFILLLGIGIYGILFVTDAAIKKNLISRKEKILNTPLIKRINRNLINETQSEKQLNIEDLKNFRNSKRIKKIKDTSFVVSLILLPFFLFEVDNLYYQINTSFDNITILTAIILVVYRILGLIGMSFLYKLNKGNKSLWITLTIIDPMIALFFAGLLITTKEEKYILLEKYKLKNYILNINVKVLLIVISITTSTIIYTSIQFNVNRDKIISLYNVKKSVEILNIYNKNIQTNSIWLSNSNELFNPLISVIKLNYNKNIDFISSKYNNQIKDQKENLYFAEDVTNESSGMMDYNFLLKIEKHECQLLDTHIDFIVTRYDYLNNLASFEVKRTTYLLSIFCSLIYILVFYLSYRFINKLYQNRIKTPLKFLFGFLLIFQIFIVAMNYKLEKEINTKLRVDLKKESFIKLNNKITKSVYSND